MLGLPGVMEKGEVHDKHLQRPMPIHPVGICMDPYPLGWAHPLSALGSCSECRRGVGAMGAIYSSPSCPFLALPPMTRGGPGSPHLGKDQHAIPYTLEVLVGGLIQPEVPLLGATRRKGTCLVLTYSSSSLVNQSRKRAAIINHAKQRRTAELTSIEGGRHAHGNQTES